MFDWNDQDQVGDTIWGELTETEDHIVPYPKSIEENTLPAFGGYNKKQSNGETSTVKRFSENTSGASNIPGSNQENGSTLDTTELSVARLDMDLWPDLPSLNSGLGRGYDNASYQGSMATELINDFSEAQNLNKMGVHIDADPEMFNDHEDKESDSFLHCDWTNIGDFDDLDRIFSSNDSIFGNEIVGNADDFLSASSDMISSTEQSFLIPVRTSSDMPLSQDQPSKHDSSSFQIEELSSGKLNLDTNTADLTVKKAGEEVKRKDFIASDCCEPSDLSEKADTQKKQQHKSRKITKESSKHSTLKSSNTAWPHSTNQKQQLSSSCMQEFRKTSYQAHQASQKQVSTVADSGQLCPSNRFMFSGYGYPPYPFPAIPVFQHVHAQRSQAKTVVDGSKASSTSSKHSTPLNKPSEIPSRPPTMTPQEKIEKLRRRQQMQAILAIQQQQQQLSNQMNNEILAPQSCSPRKQTQESMIIAAVEDGASKLLPSNTNMHVPADDIIKLPVSDDQSLAEAIYHQLQEALEKLDVKIRLCIRDSLFRLAQSAMERQCASDRSSTNKSNKDDDELPGYDETKGQGRGLKSQEAETGTNPIDRTVAQLLFHRPTESLARPVKEELQSSAMLNPASNASLNTNASTSEEVQESIEEREVQPSAQC